MNKDGAAFGRFFGGGFEGAWTPFDVPTDTAFVVTSSSVSSTGAARFRLGFCSLCSAVPSVDVDWAMSRTGTAAPVPLPADFISRGVSKVSGTAGCDVSAERTLVCAFGVEDGGLFAVVGAVK